MNKGNKLERIVTILDETTAIIRSNVQPVLNKLINRVCKKTPPLTKSDTNNLLYQCYIILHTTKKHLKTERFFSALFLSVL